MVSMQSGLIRRFRLNENDFSFHLCRHPGACFGSVEVD